MTIEYVVGDATEPSRERPVILVHICNDVGAWGKGFVVAVSQRWKEPERRFRAWARGTEPLPFVLGKVQFVAVETNLEVANLIGQHGLRRRGGVPPICYDALAEGLTRVADRAIATGAEVHMPRIGCGLAGGRWEEIEPLLQETLIVRGIAVRVYDLPDSPGGETKENG